MSASASSSSDEKSGRTKSQVSACVRLNSANVARTASRTAAACRAPPFDDEVVWEWRASATSDAGTCAGSSYV